MDVLVFLGSPRKKGNSEILTEALLKGVRQAGGTPETIRLCDLKISPCISCGGCDKTGKCVVEDDGIGRRASYRLKSTDDKKNPSKGLKLTSDRIRLLHDAVLQEERVKIRDVVDQDGHAAGTRVEVLLPLV